MSALAEYGAPTEREVQVLLIARAMGWRFSIDGCVNESEARATARVLVSRGYGEMFADERGEFFRANSAGARFLADYLNKQAAA